MHKIPLQVLLASCLCVAKKDSRQCLEFVKIQDGYVSSTDGHRLFLCDVDGLDKTLDVFIHPKHIKELCAGIKPKDRQGDVIIDVKNSGDDVIVVLTFGRHTLKFIGQDVGNYPNPKRIIPKDGFVDKMTYFNWQYLIDMQKIAELLGAYKNPIIKPTAKNGAALIEFINCDFNAVGVVMPIRY